MGIKQFHLVCTFIIWCLFSSWTKCSEKSLGMVVILPLIHIGDLWLTFSSLKELILDQTRQNRYQTVPLVCTFIIWCLFSSWSKCSEKSLGTVVILPLIHIGDLWLTFSSLKQLILDQTRQNRHQTVHLVCTFIIWCLFSSWSKCSEKSFGTVVILPLIHIGDLWLTFSSLKQLILDQTRQNRYQQELMNRHSEKERLTSVPILCRITLQNAP